MELKRYETNENDSRVNLLSNFFAPPKKYFMMLRCSFFTIFDSWRPQSFISESGSTLKTFFAIEFYY